MIVNFDAKVDQILNEGIFSTVGSFLKGAQNPTYVGELIGKFAENKKKAGEKAIGKDNPPKEGDYIQYESNTIGRVIKVLNGGANFSVVLVGMTPLSSDEYKKVNAGGIFSNFNRRSILKAHEQPNKSLTIFVKTLKNPKWHIVSVEEAKDLKANMGKPKKDQIIRDAKNIPQITFEGMGGDGTAFKEWFFYKGEIEEGMVSGKAPEPKRPPKDGDEHINTKKDGTVNTWKFNGTTWIREADGYVANKSQSDAITAAWARKKFGSP